MSLSRRRLLKLSLASSLAMTMNHATAEDDKESPVTGEAVKGLEAYDRWIAKFMAKYGIPGGQLAIGKGGEVIYSRGFGYADREQRTAVEPNSLFRIASVSKPITAVAVLLLVQRGKLKLENKIDAALKIEPHLPEGAKPDDRWEEITIAQCLSHTGGWDRDVSFDPMFAQRDAAQALGVKLPIGTAELIRYLRGRQLDFPPGKRYAYSNFGYCLLGRAIEKVTGQTYEQFVRQEVFEPLGISAPRVGRSLVEDRAAGEVTYYTVKEEQATPLVGPHAGDDAHPVPVQYGGWQQESLDSHGGWIASAADLVRFAAAFDKSQETVSKPLLKPDLVQEMFARHARVSAGDPGVHYGYGWTLGAEAGDAKHPIRAHGGALPCTAASLVKLHDDINLAVLFNLGKTKEGAWIGRGLDRELINPVAAVRG
jgi:N-acyl-D-amino-acid deacylase